MPLHRIIKNQEVKLTPTHFGQGATPIIFVGPMSIYQDFLTPAFLESGEFTVHGYTGFPWEETSTEIDSLIHELSIDELAQLFIDLKAQCSPDNPVIWLGHSSLSLLAAHCALLAPNETAGVIALSMPILNNCENLSTYVESMQKTFSANFMTKQTNDKWQRFTEAQNTYATYCEKQSDIPAGFIPFAHQQGHSANRQAEAEKLFYRGSLFQPQLDTNWESLSLSAKLYAFTNIVDQYPYEILGNLNVPILSIAGMADGIVSCCDVPDSNIIPTQYLSHYIIPEAAHMAFYEAPEIMREHLSEWLQESSLANCARLAI